MREFVWPADWGMWGRGRLRRGSEGAVEGAGVVVGSIIGVSEGGLGGVVEGPSVAVVVVLF